MKDINGKLFCISLLVLLELMGYSTCRKTQFVQFTGSYSSAERKDIPLNIYLTTPPSHDIALITDIGR